MENLHAILKTIALSLYVITFFVAIVTYKRYGHTPLRYLPILILFTVITEVLGGYIAEATSLNPNNSMVYNIYHIVAFVFFLYIIRLYLKDKLFKRIIITFILIYIASSLVNPFFKDFSTETQLGSWVMGGIFLISSVFLYYIEVLRTDRALKIKYSPLFWVGTGLLFFHVGYIPIKIIRLTYAHMELDQLWILAIVHKLLLIILYLCFNIGFIWARKNLSEL